MSLKPDPALPPDFLANIKSLESRITALERYTVNLTASSSHTLVPSYGIPDTTRTDGYWQMPASSTWRNVYSGTVALSGRKLEIPFSYDTSYITGTSITLEWSVQASSPSSSVAGFGTIHLATGLFGVSTNTAVVDLKASPLGVERGKILVECFLRVQGTGIGGVARWRLAPLYSSVWP